MQPAGTYLNDSGTKYANKDNENIKADGKHLNLFANHVLFYKLRRTLSDGIF